MAEYKRSGGFGGGKRGGFRRDGGRPSFGGKPNFVHRGGGRDGDRPQMFTATCASCHKQCEVPFRPTGDKPVYCNDCFRNVREGSSNDYGRGGDRGSRDDRGGHAREYPKRDFTPSLAPQSAPQSSDKRIDDIKRQIEAINTKLDSLIQAMGKSAPVAVVAPKAGEKKNQDVPLKALVDKALATAKKEGKKPTAKKKSSPKKK